MISSIKRLRQRREERGESGFTLIELLIVVVILGILAAIVVFAVENLSGESTSAACKSDYKTIETALEAYKANNSSYPTALNDLYPTYLRDQPATSSANGANYWFNYQTTSATIGYTLNGSDASGQCAAAGS